jgi:hypothetical protein
LEKEKKLLKRRSKRKNTFNDISNLNLDDSSDEYLFFILFFFYLYYFCNGFLPNYFHILCSTSSSSSCSSEEVVEKVKKYSVKNAASEYVGRPKKLPLQLFMGIGVYLTIIFFFNPMNSFLFYFL